MLRKIKNFFKITFYLLALVAFLLLIRKNIMWGDYDISTYRGARVRSCGYYGLWLRPLFPDVRITLKTVCMPI